MKTIAQLNRAKRRAESNLTYWKSWVKEGVETEASRKVKACEDELKKIEEARMAHTHLGARPNSLPKKLQRRLGILPAFEFANADDQAAIVAFVNEITIGNDGWAQLAPFGDYPGKAMVRQPDGSIKTFDAIQRLDRAAADGMVAKFKSPWQSVKRYFTGCNVYVGHPDVPAFANEYPDKSPKGMLVDLAVRDDGLYCKPVFTNEGSELVENKKYRAFSGYWSADPVGEETHGGRAVQVFRPDLLKSAGLTNKPNLPVHLMNEASPTNPQPTETSMKKFITWLAKHGITIANESTEDQVEAAFIAHIDPKLARGVTLANENQSQATTITARDNTITQLTTERDTLRTNFANERKSSITRLLDGAVTSGKITAAQRPTWETRLSNEASFANEATALEALQPGMKTSSVIEVGTRKIDVSVANERREAVTDLVNAEMASSKCDYTTAFARVQKANPALFEAMKQPAKTS